MKMIIRTIVIVIVLVLIIIMPSHSPYLLSLPCLILSRFSVMAGLITGGRGGGVMDGWMDGWLHGLAS